MSRGDFKAEQHFFFSKTSKKMNNRTKAIGIHRPVLNGIHGYRGVIVPQTCS